MSIATARVAGVEHIVACTAPRGEDGPNTAILYAMDQCGADTILALGGVQGIAAMTFGLFTGKPARMRTCKCGAPWLEAALAKRQP